MISRFSWCLDSIIWLGVGDCQSISDPLDCVLLTPREPDDLACNRQASGLHHRFWSFGNAERWFLPLAHCGSTSACPSSWSHTGYIGTLHASQTGSRRFSVGSSQGNPEQRVPMGKQWICTGEHRHQGMCLSTAEEVTWLTLGLGDGFYVFEVGIQVEVFDWIFICVPIATLSGINSLRHAANSQILWNLMVFRMV